MDQYHYSAERWRKQPSHSILPAGQKGRIVNGGSAADVFTVIQRWGWGLAGACHALGAQRASRLWLAQFASPSNSALAAPVDAIAVAVTAPTTMSAAESPQQPVAASKKSQKTVRSQNRRDRGWYDASARRQQYADYGRGRGYGNERPSSSW